jgi:hypothetical protein
LDKENRMEIENQDGSLSTLNSLHLDAATSTKIFNRTGEVTKITVYVDQSILK